MMPTFDGWQAAQTTLAAEKDAARRWRDATRRHRPRGQPTQPGRWLVALLVIGVLATGATLTVRSASHTTALDSSTPVDALPWQTVEAPSGAFRVELPATPTPRTSTSAAGTGQELRTVVGNVTVSAAVYAITRPANDTKALAGMLITERADQLNGYAETVRAVTSRVGEAFEAVIVAATPTAIVRVIADGLTLYLIEVQGDPTSPRTQQIYERVVFSFTPTNTH